MESKKIFSLIKETLPAPPLQRVEKASVDEVFMDLSAQIHSILLERYPELSVPPPYDDPTENLPRPPSTALEWQTDHLIDLNNDETEAEDPDWDDVVMMIGSEIVRYVRKTIYEKLKYTTSGGLARNKMLAKLASDYKKPNAQTVVRNRAVQHFLSEFKFTKIRNLGGKLGDEVVAMFKTDTVKELLEFPLEQLQRLGDDTGSWLFHTIRGEDTSEVNPRTQIKSMLSAKSFQPSVNSFEQATKWLRIFVADIFGRCVEEGVLENKRRPKTITLHHRHGTHTRSKQMSIPQGKTLSEDILFVLAKDLLAHVVADGRAWPCANLSLSVSGFEDGPSNNKGIGSFLIRGGEARRFVEPGRSDAPSLVEREEPSEKRRKMDDNRSLKGVVPQENSRDSMGADTPCSDRENDKRLFEGQDKGEASEIHDRNDGLCDIPGILPLSSQIVGAETLHQQTIDVYFCSDCNKAMPMESQAEHEDWHFAKDLSKQLQQQTRESDEISRTATSHQSRTLSKGRGRHSGKITNAKKIEKGQKTLAFGKG
jgi:DNA polymerase eta